MNTVNELIKKEYKVNDFYDALDRVCTIFEKDVLFDTISFRTCIDANSKSHRYTFWLEENNKYNDRHNYGTNYGIYDINTIKDIIIDLLTENKIVSIGFSNDKNNTLYRVKIEY